MLNASNSVRIVVTCGDVNGIGLEVLLKALCSEAFDENLRLSLCVHPPTLVEYARLLGYTLVLSDGAAEVDGKRVALLPCTTAALPIEWGTPTHSSGALAYEALQKAAAALASGQFDAVVTLPVSKQALYMAGFPFAGQTEFFGHAAGVEPLMVLATDELRVALVTIHIPLREVAAYIACDHEVSVIRRFHRFLAEDCGIVSPRIAVLGLNPHAGEGGTLGREELEIIRPALERARAEGIDVDGPHPADGFFARERWRSYDGVIAQYHDQGLIPLKMVARGRGVNITAGLPFVRTSPDHGTGYDIAGRNRAQPDSCIAALRTAQYLAHTRKRRSVSH